MLDKDVRNAVWKKLSSKYGEDKNTKLVQEMGVWSGTVRIDIAVINGELSGFELKSDKDTLERLPFQSELYSKVFDKINLVVGSKHAFKAKTLIPSWWGVIVATQEKSGVSLEISKTSEENPSPDPYLIAQLLWKDEALNVLESFNLAKGWRGKRIKLIHQRLATELPLKDLKFHVRETLKKREDWLRQVLPCNRNMTVDPYLDPVL